MLNAHYQEEYEDERDEVHFFRFLDDIRKEQDITKIIKKKIDSPKQNLKKISFVENKTKNYKNYYGFYNSRLHKMKRDYFSNLDLVKIKKKNINLEESNYLDLISDLKISNENKKNLCKKIAINYRNPNSIINNLNSTIYSKCIENSSCFSSDDLLQILDYKKNGNLINIIMIFT